MEINTQTSTPTPAPENKPEDEEDDNSAAGEQTAAPKSDEDGGGDDPDAALDAELDEIYDRAEAEANGEEYEPKSKAEGDGDKETGESEDGDGKQPRDEKGKFASKDPDAKAKGESDQDKTDTEGKGASEQNQPAAEAPGHWSREAKARFATLDPDVQKDIAAQALNDRQTISRLGQAAKDAEPVMAALAPFEEVFKREQISAAEGLDRILKVQTMLDRDPQAGLQHIAALYGVNLNDVVLNQDLGLANDPQMLALQQDNDFLRREIADIKAQQTNDTQQQQVDAVTARVNEFAADKPDFDLVSKEFEAEVAVLAQTDPDLPIDETLERAYTAALWRHPETRAKLIEEENKRRQAENRQASEEKRDQVRTARQINVNSSPPGTRPPNLDTELDAILDANGY